MHLTFFTRFTLLQILKSEILYSAVENANLSSVIKKNGFKDVFNSFSKHNFFAITEDR